MLKMFVNGFLRSENHGLGSVWDQVCMGSSWLFATVFGLSLVFHFFYLCLKIVIKVGTFLFKNLRANSWGTLGLVKDYCILIISISLPSTATGNIYLSLMGPGRSRHV